MGIVCNCKCINLKEDWKQGKSEEEEEENNKRLSTDPKNAIAEEDKLLLIRKQLTSPEPESKQYFNTEVKLTKTKTIVLKNDALVESSSRSNIKNNYLKMRILGKGAFGEVWLVRHKILNKEYAMKIIERGLENSEDYDIENEINILKKLDHPNIVKINDVYISPEKFYIVTEYCPEGNLYEELLKRGVPLSEAECAFIISQILMAMRYFHKMRIIHRDIKPENIMITKREDNGCFQVKLIDFGNAEIYSGHKEELLIGTSSFMAPEMVRDKYDERCDIWSLGVTMYELLTTLLPFKPNQDDFVVFKEVKSGKYNKTSYQYKRLSIQAKDLIDRFLTLDPEKRISVKEALSHDWFKSIEFEDKNKINKIDPDMVKYLIKNISTYRKDNILKCSVLAYLVHNNINLEPCIEARKLFNNIDYNHDGKINYEELKRGIEKFWGLSGEEIEKKAKEIFINLDNDHNNYIEYEEFVRAAVDPKIFLYENYLKFAFNYFDKDKSGDISLEDIKSKFIQNYKEEDKLIEIRLKNIFKTINVSENEPITLKIFYDIMQKILGE